MIRIFSICYILTFLLACKQKVSIKNNGNLKQEHNIPKKIFTNSKLPLCAGKFISFYFPYKKYRFVSDTTSDDMMNRSVEHKYFIDRDSTKILSFTFGIPTNDIITKQDSNSLEEVAEFVAENMSHSTSGELKKGVKVINNLKYGYVDFVRTNFSTFYMYTRYDTIRGLNISLTDLKMKDRNYLENIRDTIFNSFVIE